MVRPIAGHRRHEWIRGVMVSRNRAIQIDICLLINLLTNCLAKTFSIEPFIIRQSSIEEGIQSVCDGHKSVYRCPLVCDFSEKIN